MSRYRPDNIPIFPRTKLFSVPDLKGRGWTRTAITRFLPQPDDARDNPNPGGADMKLYLKVSVKRKERTKTWQAWLVGSTVRKQSANLGVTTKKDGLLQYIEALQIKVPLLDNDGLTARSVEHYNAFWFGKGKRASASDSQDFLDRIAVNYLRHQLTSYEQHLDQIAGKTGAYDARTALRSLIYDAIEDTYPHLSAECWKQMDEHRKKEEAKELFS